MVANKILKRVAKVAAKSVKMLLDHNVSPLLLPWFPKVLQGAKIVPHGAKVKAPGCQNGRPGRPQEAKMVSQGANMEAPGLPNHGCGD